MAAPRGRRGTARTATATPRDEASDAVRNEGAGIVPDLLRRALGIGFSGLFTTEEVLRKALGDSLPRDWTEFAAAQTERARGELIERLALELRRTLDSVDLPELLARMLESHVVEVDARIRFAPRQAGDEAGGVRIRVRREEPR